MYIYRNKNWQASCCWQSTQLRRASLFPLLVYLHFNPSSLPEQQKKCISIHVWNLLCPWISFFFLRASLRIWSVHFPTSGIHIHTHTHIQPSKYLYIDTSHNRKTCIILRGARHGISEHAERMWRRNCSRWWRTLYEVCVCVCVCVYDVDECVEGPR